MSTTVTVFIRVRRSTMVTSRETTKAWFPTADIRTRSGPTAGDSKIRLPAVEIRWPWKRSLRRRCGHSRHSIILHIENGLMDNELSKPRYPSFYLGGINETAAYLGRRPVAGYTAHSTKLHDPAVFEHQVSKLADLFAGWSAIGISDKRLGHVAGLGRGPAKRQAA